MAEHELDSMRRRFVEALRRAEIMAIVNAASTPAELARELVEELSEAYEAELVFLAEVAPGGKEWRLLATLGEAPETDALTRWGAILEALVSERAVVASGDDLLERGGRSALVRAEVPPGGRGIVAGVVRRYAQDFPEAERALLEAVMLSASHAFARLWGEEERERLIGELRETMVGTAAALATALDERDDYTGNHARDIADLAVALGERLAVDPDDLDDLRFGAIFHDIGKIAVPDEILRKPGALTDDEQRVMQGHTEAGARILEPISALDRVRPLVLHSHERWDGGGYPSGLAGEAIPLGSRIISVVDAWHAMTTERVYHRAIPASEAREELRRNAGTQFDPKVVEAFLAQLDEAEV
jgi:HD-GYP domain-containing protein (c-di-GMP phosphodiesterase class II)